MRLTLFFILFFTLLASSLFAQEDTTKPKLAVTPLFADSSSVKVKSDTSKKAITDTTKVAAKPKHDPRKATFRSAVLPGWGQAYNREYWKIPIVYGALAIPASLYVYNNNYYRWTKFAYEAQYIATYGSGDTIRGPQDSVLYKLINKKVISKLTGKPLSLSNYQSYRNSFKRNKDYCLIWFVILWGVNVADATVFGHLKDFDVSDDLTLHINPVYTPSTRSTGLSLVLNFKNPTHKSLPSF